jgi:serine/threonine-protein kinase RsbW
MPEITSVARMEHLERLIEFVAGHAEKAGFPIQRIREIELAMEEVLVNIFSYAYPDTTGDVSIGCRVEDGLRLALEISDNGLPFNILEVPNPDVTAAISDRQVGGLGAFFVREMADKAQYRREGGRNILMLIFERHRHGSEGQEHAGDVQK